MQYSETITVSYLENFIENFILNDVFGLILSHYEISAK